MTVLASDIITRAQTIVQDTTGVRWPTAELLHWLNDGQREVANVKPSATAFNTVVNLQQGTLQQIGAGNLSLLRVIRNLKTPVTTPRIGTRAVRMVSLDVMDAQNPRWHDPTAFPYTKEVKHCCFDAIDPTAFYVFPGNDGTGAMEVTMSRMPEDIAAASAPISLPDIYRNPLLDYVLFRAYQKDADQVANAERSANHYELFAASITAKVTNESTVNPNTRGAA